MGGLRLTRTTRFLTEVALFGGVDCFQHVTVTINLKSPVCVYRVFVDTPLMLFLTPRLSRSEITSSVRNEILL